MGISTFGSFTQARLGIYAAQSGMSVTGNNISNINTDGYTRQKLQQRSFYAGGADRYYSTYDIRIGNGVLATGVSQMRDPYLDIRYRNEMASVGANDAKLAGLEQIQHVLDEVGDGEDAFGILSNHFSDFLSKLHQLSDQTGLAEYDIQVRSSAETLAKQFNSYASQLEKIYQNSLTSFKQDIAKVNNILDGIRSLNSSIRKAEIHGDRALELRDERDLLIDELSAFVKIDVNYDMEEIGGGVKVERLTISLGNANPQNFADNTDCAVLIDGIYGRNICCSDDAHLNMSLSALVDSQGRPQYTLAKQGEYPISSSKVLTGTNVTDPDTGVTTITTYEKIGQNKANPLYDPENPGDVKPFVDKDGNPTDDQFIYRQTVYTRTPNLGTVTLHDNDLYGSLQAQREFLTESGEFSTYGTLATDPGAGSKRGISFYRNALDLLAKQFAKTFNDANSGYYRSAAGNYINSTGYEITVNVNGEATGISVTNGLTAEQRTAILQEAKNSGSPYANYIITGKMTNPDDPDGPMIDVPVDVDLDAYVRAHDAQYRSEVLFSNNGANDDPDNITATNISISKGWAGGPKIINSFIGYPSDEGMKVASTDSSNINHMIIKMTEKMEYDPGLVQNGAASSSMFKGDFNEMWVNMGTLLGNDINSTTTILDTYYASSVEIDTSRASVSSVDLNDEAANLMQYSQSYNAACRLMTTLDAMLDKLINGTGILT